MRAAIRGCRPRISWSRVLITATLAVADEPVPGKTPPYPLWQAWWGLIVMSIQMVLVNVDYSIVTLLVSPIESGLHVDDLGFATLTATATSIGYSLFSYPAGLVADSYSRRDMIALGSVVWGIGGFIGVISNSPEAFFIARFIAGMGTVFMGVAMYPLLYDMFPSRLRALANGTFSSTSAIGLGIGISICGTLVDVTHRIGTIHAFGMAIVPWQQCFIGVAAGGLISGAIMLSVRKPPRRDTTLAANRANLGHSVRDFTAYLRHHGFLWVALFGASTVTSIVMSGVQQWAPAFATRRYGIGEVELTAVLGTMTAVGSLLGSVLGGVFAQVMINTGKARLLPHCLIVSTVVGAVAYTVFPYASSWAWAAAGIGVGLATQSVMAVLIFLAIQEAAPNEVRSQLFGFYLGLTLFSGVIGPTLIAFFAETVFAHAGGLGPATAWVSVVSNVIGGAAYLLAIRPYREAMISVAVDPA